MGADPPERSPCDGCSEAPGCGGFAKALVRGGFEGPQAAQEKGTEVSSECGSPGDSGSRFPDRKAAILCIGSHVAPRYRYAGAPSCRTSSRMAANPRECANACLGFGDCCSACPSHAISVEMGIARIDPSRCDGCGDCLGSCPLALIALVPCERGFAVLCKGPRGPSRDWTCPDGCTACGLCSDACPQGALKAGTNGFPQWIEERCDECGLCSEACPQQVIFLSGPLKPAGQSHSRRATHCQGSGIRDQGPVPHASQK